MMWKRYIVVSIVLTLLPSMLVRAADSETAPLPPGESTLPESNTVATSVYPWSSTGTGVNWLAQDRRDFDIRFGWWGTAVSGSQRKTGEFQDLDPSPFWDADGLISSGDRSLDFTATGTDNESTQGRLKYYSPRVTVDADYERFIHRLDPKGLVIPNPLDPGTFIFENFNPNEPPSPAPSAQRVLNSDVLNAGQDYAIRVQEYKANFHGPIGENLKWRLNVWGIEKQGVRQATKLAHCFNESSVTAGQPTGSRCHLLAQPQRIDWATNEIEPVLEAKIGSITAEYSRTMRSFQPNDQTVTRLWTQSHDGWPITSNLVTQNPIPYDQQTQNFTQIDRLKLSSDINDYNHFYGYMYIGDTENQLRDTHRSFNGFDLRWTNDSIDGFKWTAYGKKSNESGQLPTTFPESSLIQGGDTIADYHNPLNYDRTAAGLKGNWRPYASGWPAARGLGFTGGYEYSKIHRTFAVYEGDDPRWVTSTPPDVFDVWEFEQPDTIIHMFNVGTEMRWSSSFDTVLRYKFINANNPIYGYRATNGDTNTNQPNQSDLIEIGGTWIPADNFLMTATFYIEARRHNSQIDNLSQAFEVLHDNPRENDFSEFSYPFVLSAWYAPSQKWSLNGGYASFSNWIDQLITLGDLYGDNLLNTSGSTVANGSPPPAFIGARDYFEPDAYQSRWRYAGQSQVINLGAAYAYTQRLRLNGGYGYTWSRNLITSAPSPATAYDPSDTTPPPTVVVPDWTLIPTLSEVHVVTHRVTAGFDYALRERIGLYFRYNLFDYEDISRGINTGVAHMFLGGFNAVY